jgi:multiple sugar transport system permease protein
VIAIVFPYFDIGRRLDLLDSVWILVIIYTLWNVPWGIWLVRGFIQDVPRELEESSMVDGSSRLGAMLRVTLPLAAPGLTAAAILLFIGAWNEFTLAFFLTSREARTYPTSIGFFLTHAGVQWGEMFATALIGTLPVVIFAFLVRKTFISSLSFGAVKG